MRRNAKNGTKPDLLGFLSLCLAFTFIIAFVADLSVGSAFLVFMLVTSVSAYRVSKYG